MAARHLLKIRLRLVKREHFRCTEATMWKRLTKSERAQIERSFDGVLFVSKSDNQAVFVYNVQTVGFRVVKRGKNKGKRIMKEIVPSIRIRFSNGVFSEDMIQNYANEAGLELEGIPTLQEYYRLQVAA